MHTRCEVQFDSLVVLPVQGIGNEVENWYGMSKFRLGRILWNRYQDMRCKASRAFACNCLPICICQHNASPLREMPWYCLVLCVAPCPSGQLSRINMPDKQHVVHSFDWLRCNVQVMVRVL